MVPSPLGEGARQERQLIVYSSLLGSRESSNHSGSTSAIKPKNVELPAALQSVCVGGDRAYVLYSLGCAAGRDVNAAATTDNHTNNKSQAVGVLPARS